ncbi:MAG TPA: KpsF/GutQ family sugar-phosphate isomerase [Planctomycetaceae bacterium]|nr:KpsF/GutQ family sugar-phosphate isomerase [Planctomycetaceae bacterium]
MTTVEAVDLARQIIRTEAAALLQLANQLPEEFTNAARAIFSCQATVIFTGIGKAGLIAQKLVATFGSTGTPAHFLHPSEAVHGDLGRIASQDVVVLLSYSGETAEITRLLPSLQQMNVTMLAITADHASSLGRAAQIVLDLGKVEEACNLKLAPSTSTTMMLALGDALAFVVSRMRCFGKEDFARFHPAGSLGRQLARVEDVMRPLEQCRLAPETLTVREVFTQAVFPGRRTGAVMLTNEAGLLTGLFTDSDLVRLLEQKQDAAIDQPVRNVMTRQPYTVATNSFMNVAVDLLANHKISELPVVDQIGAPIGLIDITDTVAGLPSQGTTSKDPLARWSKSA